MFNQLVHKIARVSRECPFILNELITKTMGNARLGTASQRRNNSLWRLKASVLNAHILGLGFVARLEPTCKRKNQITLPFRRIAIHTQYTGKAKCITEQKAQHRLNALRDQAMLAAA